MPFVTLLLDSNYLTSARHSPKKWNVNYITIAGLTEDEQAVWNEKYGTDWSSVDSELHKELAVVNSMLNLLENFGYQLLSTMTSNPRVGYKDTENNRECYIWTLRKPSIGVKSIEGISSTPLSNFCDCTSGTPLLDTETGTHRSSSDIVMPVQSSMTQSDATASGSNCQIFRDIETIFRSMAFKEHRHRLGGRSLTTLKNASDNYILDDSLTEQVSQI